MSEENIMLLMKIIRDINDNLWLGDLDNVQEMLHYIEENILNRPDIMKMKEAFEKARISLRRIRQEGKDKTLEWVTDRYLQELRRLGITTLDVIGGLLITRLAYVKHFINWVREKRLAVPEVLRKDRYRCRILSDPPIYEVRALIDTPISSLDFYSLKRALERKFNVILAEPERANVTTVLRAFSQNEYFLITIQDRLVRMLIIMREPSTERVRTLVNIILDILTGARIY